MSNKDATELKKDWNSINMLLDQQGWYGMFSRKAWHKAGVSSVILS